VRPLRPPASGPSIRNHSPRPGPGEEQGGPGVLPTAAGKDESGGGAPTRVVSREGIEPTTY